jgi:Na+-driven multidrug efflux pump
MACLCIPYFICGMMDVTTGVLRGLKVSLLPMFISIIGVCVFRVVWVLTIFRLPGFHTPEWLLANYPISWIITFTSNYIAYRIVWHLHTKKDSGLLQE